MKKNRKFAPGWQKFTPDKNGFDGDARWSCTSSLHDWDASAKYGNPRAYDGCCDSEACIAQMKVFIPTGEETKDTEIAGLKLRASELETMVKDRESQIKYHVENADGLRKAYNNAQDAIRSLEELKRETDRKNFDLQIEKERYRILSIALAKFGGIAQ